MKNETLRKMREIRLSAMAEAYEQQLERPDHFSPMTFDERLGMLVEREYDKRHNNHLARLLNNAKLIYPDASLNQIEYLPDRHLNKELIDLLGTNNYIERHRNIIIVGATGSSKTYLANALGAHACYSDFKVLYMRLPDLFDAYHMAVINNKRDDFLRKCQKTTVLILDEFLLYQTTEDEQQILLEIMERRVGRTTTIVCSQYGPEGWHERLGGLAIADAILDRLTSAAYTIEIDGKESMRKRHADD